MFQWNKSNDCKADRNCSKNKKVVRVCKTIHCMIHRQALTSKIMPINLKLVVDSDTKVVNLIKDLLIQVYSQYYVTKWAIIITPFSSTYLFIIYITIFYTIYLYEFSTWAQRYSFVEPTGLFLWFIKIYLFINWIWWNRITKKLLVILNNDIKTTTIASSYSYIFNQY